MGSTVNMPPQQLQQIIMTMSNRPLKVDGVIGPVTMDLFNGLKLSEKALLNSLGMDAYGSQPVVAGFGAASKLLSVESSKDAVSPGSFPRTVVSGQFSVDKMVAKLTPENRRAVTPVYQARLAEIASYLNSFVQRYPKYSAMIISDSLRAKNVTKEGRDNRKSAHSDGFAVDLQLPGQDRAAHRTLALDLVSFFASPGPGWDQIILETIVRTGHPAVHFGFKNEDDKGLIYQRAMRGTGVVTGAVTVPDFKRTNFA